MKINKKVILAGAVLLTFAACKTEMKQPTEAEIDALVNEKVEAVKKQLQEDCNANLLAAANAEADKILMDAANKPAKVVQAPAPKPKPKKPTAKPTPKEPKPKTKVEKEADKVNNRFKKDVKAETEKVNNRFKKKATEESIKDETQKVKNRFGK